MMNFVDYTKRVVSNLRNQKGSLNFIQIGAYDGVSFNDMANLTLLPTDNGIFIEPNDNIFDTLKQNKILFDTSTFLKVAIIPNKTFDHESFYIDKSGGQSTFVENVFNSRIHIVDNVQVLTIDELYDIYVNFSLDIIYLDCEGYDHDIIVNLLKREEPKIIYFESWNTKNLNTQLSIHKFTTREEILDILLSKGYVIRFDPIEENVIAHKYD